MRTRAFVFFLVALLGTYPAASAELPRVSDRDSIEREPAESVSRSGADVEVPPEFAGRDAAAPSSAHSPRPRADHDPWSSVFAEPVPLATTFGPDTGAAESTALAAGDFDEDGVPDLVCGHTTEQGSFLTISPGNVDAIFPHTPGARQREAAGAVVAQPFSSSTGAIELTQRPDELVSGDFDNDGHFDVVVATRGRHELRMLKGNGAGGLSAGDPIVLPGTITSVVAGEINRVDGLTDIAVGIHGPAGPAVLVFEGPDGALRSEPESIVLPAVAHSLALERKPTDGIGDLRIATDGGDWIVEGRDRRLSYTEMMRKQVRPPTLRSGEVAAERLDGAMAVLGYEPLAALPMRLNQDGLTDFVVVDESGSVFVLPTAIQATITVDFAPDTSTPGDGLCSLREAIDNANADADTTLGDCVAGAGADLIAFNIAGGGALATIAPLTPLPNITGTTTLNGNTQACGSPPCVELDGTGTLDVEGLYVFGGNSVVRGFAVHSFDEAGIRVEATGCLVEGNYSGTDPAGMLAQPNRTGIRLTGADDCVVGGTIAAAGNLCSGNENSGIAVSLGSGNEVLGNVTGLDATGTAVLDNFDGVEFNSTTAGNTCGGTAPGARNVISGNRFGLVYFGSGLGNIAQGNYIGTDPTGAVALGNTDDGLLIQQAEGVTVGGTAVGAGNLVSGNADAGILQAQFGGTGGSVFQGNLVGTDVTGTLPLANGGNGMLIDASFDNIVGGGTPAARNVLSGNGASGFRLQAASSTGNVVSGNHMGVDINGIAILGNGTVGAVFSVGTSNNVLGGTGASEGNVISGNGDFGVVLVQATGNLVQGNRIGTDVTGTVPLPNTLSGVGLDGASGNTIGGTLPGARNIISGNGQTGIFALADGAVLSTGNVIQGNYIGTDPTGQLAVPNGFHGVTLQDTVNTLVGGTVPAARNLLSGNTQNGVRIDDLADGDRIVGNYIGVDVTGTVSLGNTLRGVRVQDGATNIVLGGTAPGEGNVISGNGTWGVSIVGAGAGTVVEGNLIGLDVTGAVGIGNGNSGVNVEDSPGTRLGGTTPEARNVISANGLHGISVANPLSDGTLIQGNYVGTNATGTAALGNAARGVYITDSSDNIVGGTEAGAGNLISGNLIGVLILEDTDPTDDNEIRGNLIGTDASGTQALPNSFGVIVEGGDGNLVGGTDPAARNVISGNTESGVVLQSGADSNTVAGNSIGVDITGLAPLPNDGEGVKIDGGNRNMIGGTATGAANVIRANGRDGVWVADGARNGILGNSISSSGLLGIELGDADGVTPNDDLDADAGPNGLQNYPVLGSATATATGITIGGDVSTQPNLTYRVEFFTSDACDGSGHGEGVRYLGFASVTTNASGAASFNEVLAQPVSDGDAVTATASGPFNSTSEFSACVTATCATLVPFPATLFAQDPVSLAWTGAQDVRFAKGNLADVSSYTTSQEGNLFGASGLDISGDDPPAGGGLYYVVRPLGCGSWQTSLGAEPARDGALP